MAFSFSFFGLHYCKNSSRLYLHLLRPHRSQVCRCCLSLCPRFGRRHLLQRESELKQLNTDTAWTGQNCGQNTLAVPAPPCFIGCCTARTAARFGSSHNIRIPARRIFPSLASCLNSFGNTGLSAFTLCSPHQLARIREYSSNTPVKYGTCS